MAIGLFRALLLCVSFTFSAHAFVTFPVGSRTLQWNVNSPGNHPNSVNPATKAVRYYIASDAYSEANRTNEINAVRACFDQWQSITGSHLRFEFAGLISPVGLDLRFDNTNVVFWAKKSTRVAAGFVNISGRRGYTLANFTDQGVILDADIVLNGVDFEWFTDFNNTTNQAAFVEGSLLHEIGHFVGLDHTPAGGATVINGANGIGTEAGLSADEIAAMRFLYPTGPNGLAVVRGTVRLNGAGILGAMVLAEDAAGNLAGATVTRASGFYEIPSLAAGSYSLRVCPFDPRNSGGASLLRAAEIAQEYEFAPTAFLPTANSPAALQAGEIKTLDFNVTPTEPAFRITSISKPSTILNLISVNRHAVAITQGQSNLFIAVSSPTLLANSTLSVSGAGLMVGPSKYYPNRFAGGIHSLEAPISVSSSAPAGLRSLIVTHASGTAYANGYLEIAAPIPDYNFDAFDDRFQRAHWRPWTDPASAPGADPDQDLFSNRYEFRTGTNPLDKLSRHFALEYHRENAQLILSWTADIGKKYQLSSRPKFGSGEWSPYVPVITTSNERVSVPAALIGPEACFRLELLP